MMTTMKVRRRVRKSKAVELIKGLLQITILFTMMLSFFYAWCSSAYDRGNYYRELSMEQNDNTMIEKVETAYGN